MKPTMHHRLPAFLAGSLLLHMAGLLVFAPQASRENQPGWSLAIRLLPPSLASPATLRLHHNGAANRTIVLNQFDHADARLKSRPVDSHDSIRDPDDIVTKPGAFNIAPDGAHARSASPEMRATGQEIQHQLVAAMLPYFDYPLFARRQGWQGEVQLAVHVARDGRLTALRLARSSGYPILDAAALESLGKVHRLPDSATRQLDNRGFDLRVPVVYRLTEG